MPLDGVCVVDNDVLAICDVHGFARIRGDAQLNHAVGIVQDLKVDVREQVVPQVWLLA